MKFAHIADTHIKNLKYHFEYRKVFAELYDILRKEQVDYIIHCGDIAHTKTQISPEFVDMCSRFFRSLSSGHSTAWSYLNRNKWFRIEQNMMLYGKIVFALNVPN